MTFATKRQIFVSSLLTAASQAFQAAAAAQDNQEKFVVHFLPHTHFENTGFGEWPSEVNYRQNVKDILTSLLSTLSEDVHRKFNWSELQMLERWWNDPSTEPVDKEIFMKMVKTG